MNGARHSQYRGTAPIRNQPPLGPYRRPMPRVLEGSQGGGRLLMSKVPLYREVRVLHMSKKGESRGIGVMPHRTHHSYRTTSLIRKRHLLGPNSRPMPMVLGRSGEGGLFL